MAGACCDGWVAWLITSGLLCKKDSEDWWRYWGVALVGTAEVVRAHAAEAAGVEEGMMGAVGGVLDAAAAVEAGGTAGPAADGAVAVGVTGVAAVAAEGVAGVMGAVGIAAAGVEGVKEVIGAVGIAAAAAEGITEVVEAVSLSSGNLDARDSCFFFSAAKTWKLKGSSSSESELSDLLPSVPVSTI